MLSMVTSTPPTPSGTVFTGCPANWSRTAATACSTTVWAMGFVVMVLGPFPGESASGVVVSAGGDEVEALVERDHVVIADDVVAVAVFDGEDEPGTDGDVLGDGGGLDLSAG